MNFILKIVEGPNKGAEIALVEGVAVTLGKGDDCDIVLADPTLPDESLTIEASASGVTIGGEALEPLNVKTVGATSFAVGPADSPWGELVWPKAEPQGKPETSEKPEKAEALEIPEKPEPPEKPAEPANKKHRGYLGCLVVLILLLFVLAALAWFFRDDPRLEDVKNRVTDFYGKTVSRFSGGTGGSEDGCEPAAAPVVYLAAVAAKYGLALNDSGETAKISGNFKTRRERLAATAEAYAVQPGVELDLSDDESFRTAAEDALFTLSEGALKVASATNRFLSIVGSSKSPMALKKTLVALNADLPKLGNIDVSGVVFGRMVASGNESAEESVDAEQVPVRVSRRAAKKSAPSFPVCGILTTPYPCIVLRDGRCLMEGAAMGDSIIAEIGADSVTLTNSTGRLTWKP